MIVQFLDAPDFTVDRHGRIEQHSSWLLSFAAGESGDIANEALHWAGNVGDPGRKPNAEGNDFVSDDSFVVTNIKCTALDSRCCRITFTAVSGGDADLPDTEPVTPDSTLQVGVWQQIKDEFNDEGEFKIASIIIPDDELADFLLEHGVHSAVDWAENYYVYLIRSEPSELPRHTLLTVTARKSELQMIENLRSEEVTSAAFGELQTLSVWKSRWRATADDRELFSAKLGTSAADWTGDENTIVSKVTPKRISDCEFEYTLEARYPAHINTHHSYDRRDDDLPDRLEYYIRIGEMRLSAMQCGYVWRYSGRYTAINNWNAAMHCPLSTVGALPLNFINQRLKVLEITEVSYLKGTSGENMTEAVTWFTGSRVENLTIAGITGNFLRSDLDVDDLTDSYDREWTRITKVYRLAPANYTWNNNYWI